MISDIQKLAELLDYLSTVFNDATYRNVICREEKYREEIENAIAELPDCENGQLFLSHRKTKEFINYIVLKYR